MFNRYLTFYRPGMQLVVFLALLSMTWFLGVFVLEMLNQQILGLSTEQFTSLKEVPQELAGKLKLTEILALIFMLLLPAALFAYLAHPHPLKYLRIQMPSKVQFWILGILVMAIALPFSGMLEAWSAKLPFPAEFTDMDQRYTSLAKSMLSGTHWTDLCINILVISIAPAIIEELFFRACLQNVLISWMNKNHFTALLLTAIIFSAFHGQMSGFFPRVFLGLLLGLGYYYSGSLWVSISMHAFNNLVSVVLVYLYNIHEVTIDITSLPEVPLIWGLLSAFVTLAIVYYFYKIRVPYEIVAVEQDIVEIKTNEDE